MKNRIALCVGLGVAAFMATSAQAQVYLEPGGQAVPPPQHEYGGLPPSEILMAVRSSGLRPLTQPARLGPQQYAVLASDNMGGQLRVVVHAHTGRIINASPAHDPRFAYHPVRPRGFVPTPAPQHGVVMPPPTYSAAPPDLRTPSAPPPAPPRTARATQTPPAAAPSHNPSLAGAPDTTGSVPTRPARTPLPRPRPAVAANQANATAPTAPAPVQARPVETSPEAEAPAAAQPAPAPAAPSAAPATPAPSETQMVPVAPLD